VIKEAIEYLQEIAHPFDVNGQQFSVTPLTPVRMPLPEPVRVTTLKGLHDLYASELDDITEGHCLCHVQDPWTVVLASDEATKDGQRRVWAVASYGANKIETFPFNSWLQPDHFVLMAQARIQRVKIEEDDGSYTKDLDYVLKIASNITSTQTIKYADDGIAQEVEVKRGVKLVDRQELKNRVTLAPYRTFAEIDQVLSEFVFRARDRNGEIELALFEADGGRWKLQAISEIEDWLNGKFGSKVPIIA
jgi:hypothetical protein